MGLLVVARGLALIELDLDIRKAAGLGDDEVALLEEFKDCQETDDNDFALYFPAMEIGETSPEVVTDAVFKAVHHLF